MEINQKHHSHTIQNFQYFIILPFNQFPSFFIYQPNAKFNTDCKDELQFSRMVNGKLYVRLVYVLSNHFPTT